VPDWAAFVGLTGVLLLFLLALSRASQRLVTGEDTGTRSLGEDPTLPGPGELADSDPNAPGAEKRERIDGPDASSDGGEAPADPQLGAPEAIAGVDRPSAERSRTAPVAHTLDAETGPPSTTALLVNVTLSQAVFGTLLALGAWLTAIPPDALGLTAPPVAAVGVGIGLGAGLYLANELGAALAERLGVDHDESLRELLAPSSLAGWALLLGVVLPVVAGFEELLFRAALVGVVSTAYPVAAWTMVAVSSVAFGLGHGAQGTGGIVVTAVLGVVLGAAYVVTGSLLVVFVAHYLVNALEFVVHEGLGLEWVE